jgi:hypothetical protein
MTKNKSKRRSGAGQVAGGAISRKNQHAANEGYGGAASLSVKRDTK